MYIIIIENYTKKHQYDVFFLNKKEFEKLIKKLKETLKLRFEIFSKFIE